MSRLVLPEGELDVKVAEVDVDPPGCLDDRAGFIGIDARIIPRETDLASGIAAWACTSARSSSAYAAKPASQPSAVERRNFTIGDILG